MSTEDFNRLFVDILKNDKKLKRLMKITKWHVKCHLVEDCETQCEYCYELEGHLFDDFAIEMIEIMTSIWEDTQIKFLEDSDDAEESTGIIKEEVDSSPRNESQTKEEEQQ